MELSSHRTLTYESTNPQKIVRGCAPVASSHKRVDDAYLYRFSSLRKIEGNAREAAIRKWAPPPAPRPPAHCNYFTTRPLCMKRIVLFSEMKARKRCRKFAESKKTM
ncbi:hypothetical protein EVAR_47420_1 [Eumeta japonica]|uniref:Uncharacterized protein n=1 Tax=Eumeta variegata TaxID=151549 RepID=A0A4C1Y415_EUMVA|nr:hypothetical protein EVAR_47420_1 [Eumeta japonica]